MTTATDQPIPTTPRQAADLRAWAVARLPRQVTLTLPAGTVTAALTGTVPPHYDLTSRIPTTDGRTWSSPAAFLCADDSIVLGVAVTDQAGHDASPDDLDRIERAVEAVWSPLEELRAALALAEVCDTLEPFLASTRDDTAVLTRHQQNDVRELLCLLAAHDLPAGPARDAAVRMVDGWAGSPAQLVAAAHDVTS